MRRLAFALLGILLAALPALYASAYSTPSLGQDTTRPAWTALRHPVQQRGGSRPSAPPPQSFRPQPTPSYQQRQQSFSPQRNIYRQQQPAPWRPAAPSIVQRRLPLGGGFANRNVPYRSTPLMTQGGRLRPFWQSQALAQRQRALPQTALRSNATTGLLARSALLRPRMLASTAAFRPAAYSQRSGWSFGSARSRFGGGSAGQSYSARSARPAFNSAASPRAFFGGGCAVSGVRHSSLDLPNPLRDGTTPFPPGSYQVAAVEADFAIETPYKPTLENPAQRDLEPQVIAEGCVVSGSPTGDNRPSIAFSRASGLAIANYAARRSIRASSQSLLGIHPRVAGQLLDQRLGLLRGKLAFRDVQNLANSPNASRYIDKRNNGNINVIQKVQGKLIRITVARDANKIISVGPIREPQVRNLIARGDYERM